MRWSSYCTNLFGYNSAMSPLCRAYSPPHSQTDYTVVTATKKLCGLSRQKLVAVQRPLSDRNPISQLSSTPERLLILKISLRSVAYIMLSETILTSNQQQQSEAVSAVRVIQGHMVPFDRSHTTSYSTSKATTCLSRAVLEIGRDINTANVLPTQQIP